MDAEKTLLLKDATRKILLALQVLLSKEQVNMDKHISEHHLLHAEESQAIGHLFDSACSSTAQPADSGIFVGRDLTNQKDILAHRIAASIAKEVAKLEFQARSQDTSASITEGAKIVDKLPSDPGMITEIPKPAVNPHILMVPRMFVEEILSRFLPKVLISTNGRSLQHQRRLSRAEVNTLAENLNHVVEEGLSRHQISLVPATGEKPPLHPEQEGALIPGSRKYYLIMSQSSGSEQDLYDDVTGFDAHLHQDAVMVIIEELSNCPLLWVVSNRLSQSTTDPDRIANEALSQLSISAKSKSLRDEEAVPGTSADKTPTGTEELAMLRALQPKVDLLAQLAAHCTEDEEGEERVEDDLESEQQWEEEEELQQIEETAPVESSLCLWSPLGSFTDTEPSR
ncbi:hypothetical protein Y1Q_0010242 [Alligator mississippiensis]|uniref:Fibrous sheath-interacting protein 2 C-terminal domain-containing protein n=1 Tax=Alligator mississippiensis TaxID=8496 RepID=A0A151MZH7_ALLMI|nr:hypothetical protein Y1Q_0010242 [Alligator mississippiensis]